MRRVLSLSWVTGTWELVDRVDLVKLGPSEGRQLINPPVRFTVSLELVGGPVRLTEDLVRRHVKEAGGVCYRIIQQGRGGGGSSEERAALNVNR